MRIGDLAEATGTKVVTVRYYEKIGLLPKPLRTAGNYRAYEGDHLQRLRFIRRCRELGFTLDQVRELLGISGRDDQDCSEVDRITGEHLTAVERKISDLSHLAKELRRISSCCQGGRMIGDCGSSRRFPARGPSRAPGGKRSIRLRHSCRGEQECAAP